MEGLISQIPVWGPMSEWPTIRSGAAGRAFFPTRTGDPDEIVKAVSFPASDDASYVSGIELFVVGGSANLNPQYPIPSQK